MQRSPRVVLIATFDTKGDEAVFLRDELAARGLVVASIDAGVSLASRPEVDFASSQVAMRAGTTIEELRARNDTGRAIEAMSVGVTRILKELVDSGDYDGVVGLGGGKGTAICSRAMLELPWGFPKLIVSTQASGNTRRYLDCQDIILIPSIADLMGLNPLTRLVLRNAGSIIAGLVKDHQVLKDCKEPLVGMTAFGVTTPAIMECKRLVRERSRREAVVFHASGSGGRGFEKAITDGLVNSVIDLTLTEFADEVGGGIAAAGDDRLTSAARLGIPQVVCPGAIDVVNLGSVKPEYPERYTYYNHTPVSLLRRTTPEECAHIGEMVCTRLNAALGPCVVLIPMRGVSAYDRDGGVFYNPQATIAFKEAVLSNIRSGIVVEELNYHINDPGFARRAVEWLLSLEEVAHRTSSASSRGGRT